MFDFIKNKDNEVCLFNGFFVSYNKNPGGIVTSFRGDGGSDETALVLELETGRKFFIKNGDMRKKIKKCKTKKDVLKLFMKSELDTSSRSTIDKEELQEYISLIE